MRSMGQRAIRGSQRTLEGDTLTRVFATAPEDMPKMAIASVKSALDEMVRGGDEGAHCRAPVQAGKDHALWRVACWDISVTTHMVGAGVSTAG